MKNRFILNIFCLFTLLPLVSCNAADRSEARAEIGDEKVSVLPASHAKPNMRWQIVKHKLFLVFLLLLGLLALTACNPDAAAQISAAAEPTAVPR